MCSTNAHNLVSTRGVLRPDAESAACQAGGGERLALGVVGRTRSTRVAARTAAGRERSPLFVHARIPTFEAFAQR